MPQCNLRIVRTDDQHVVFTEHPDHIHTRDLSAWLRGRYGESSVKIYLVKDIYVIYVDRDAVDTSELNSLPMTDSANTCRKTEERPMKDWEQRLSDVKEAQEVLKKYRSSRS
ncbi:hypothetical protein F4825DRAFT_456894 [Nemania diffusa]|nr:hypothetical protein F4825DRAFT_456894 [Nemania diffusa]